jgi:hypothetical protein
MKYNEELENYQETYMQLKNQNQTYKHRAQVTEEDLEHKKMKNADFVQWTKGNPPNPILS